MKTNYARNQMLNLRYGDGTYTKPTTVYCSLFSAPPTVAGDDGTELSLGTYARVAKTNNATNFPDPVVDGEISNGTVVTFPAASENQGHATHFGWWDDPTAGNLLDFAPLGTPVDYDTGIAPTFPIGTMIWIET